MSNSDKHIEKRKQELLNKYLNEQISKEERFELEKLALDDEFLFEALEGFHIVQAPHEQNLAVIQTAIDRKVGEKPERKLRLMYWRISSIAAVLLLLITITFVIRNHSLNNLNEVFATADVKNSTATDNFEEASHDSSVYASTENSKALLEQGLENIIVEDRDDHIIKAKIESIVSTNETSIEALEEDLEVVQAVEDKDLEEVISIQKNEEIDNILKEDSYQSKKRAVEKASKVPAADTQDADEYIEPIDLIIEDEAIRVGNSFIEGKVTSEDGEPLIGATIQIPETDQGTVTDLEGNFNIDVPKEAQELEISYTGFNNVKVAIDGISNLAVTLKEGTQLSEVVVIDASRSFNAAIPEIGFEEFNLFVDDNLIKPKQAKDANITGVVIIEFTVGPYGKLSNFRVIKSLGYGCDEEAIRILQLGGKWDTFPKFKSIKTQYQFYF